MNIRLEFPVTPNPQITYCVWGIAERQEEVDPMVPRSVCISPGGLSGCRDLPCRGIHYGALMGESIESKLATVSTIYIEYVKYESRNRSRDKTHSRIPQYHGRACR